MDYAVYFALSDNIWLSVFLVEAKRTETISGSPLAGDVQDRFLVSKST